MNNFIIPINNNMNNKNCSLKKKALLFCDVSGNYNLLCKL